MMTTQWKYFLAAGHASLFMNYHSVCSPSVSWYWGAKSSQMQELKLTRTNSGYVHTELIKILKC